MIGALRGRLLELEAGDQVSAAVVDVAGVGYEVLLASRLAATIGPIGGEVALSVHTHVREGAITLYGFSSPGERRAFRVLVSAHGVGPALGLAILGTHPPASLARAVATEDVEALMAVPGVGRKTAQRLVVDLAGRLEELPVAPRGAVPPGGGVGAEVSSALAGLGYGPDEIRHALEQLEEGPDTPTLLRQALRALAPHR